VTQLYDDVNDLDDPWYAGRLDPAPGTEPPPRPQTKDHLGHEGREAPEAMVAGEPLFEQLREAYLQRDDTNEWAREGGTNRWVDDGAGRRVDDGADRWVDDGAGRRVDDGADRRVDDGADRWADDGADRWASVGTADFQDGDSRFRWVDEPASAWESAFQTGWDETEDDLDEDEVDELEPEPFAPRGRGSARRSRSGPGRAGLRRTSTLLNASTVLIFVGGALAAAALTGLIITSRLLTTRQLFFLAHSTFGIVIVHAFGGGLGTLLTTRDSRMKDRIRKVSTAALAVVAWLASATGTWFGYAGYRAKVPPGGDIAMYPREYLLDSQQLAFWETSPWSGRSTSVGPRRSWRRRWPLLLCATGGGWSPTGWSARS
jgi:hypothetical protein